MIDCPIEHVAEKMFSFECWINNNAMEVNGVTLVQVTPDDLIRITDAKNNSNGIVNLYLELQFLLNVAYDRVPVIVAPDRNAILLLIYNRRFRSEEHTSE